jgi:hypothetical protein
MVSIGADDERFLELTLLFAEYWREARVLTTEALTQYRALYGAYQKIAKDIETFESQVHQAIGRHAFQNIQRGLARPEPEDIFVDAYRKIYQEAIVAFRRIRDVYEAMGTRRFPADAFPLRLEIDLFVNYVRDHFAERSTWQSTPLGWSAARQLQVKECIETWHRQDTSGFEQTVVYEKYPRLLRAFSSREHLAALGDDELFEALLTINSFHDRLRFFSGGLPGLKNAFLGGNEAARVRASLGHLVFGTGDPVVRMADLLYDDAYKLTEFGQANVQELIGWINREQLPVVNGRTTKIFRYFGLQVQQL